MRETSPEKPPKKRARGRPRAWHDKTEQNTIKSLDRAMEVFEHLSRGTGQTLSEVASDLDQSPATVYRVLVTLEGRGLVEFDSEDQLWHVGAQAFLIGARYLRRSSLVERARPVLRRLMENTGETANLGREQDGQVIFLSQVETHESIRAFFPPGTLGHMHSSGIGKALMAQMSGERLAIVINKQGLTRYTPHTIVDPSGLRIELQQIRDQGYSVDAEERNLGMRCIAAPVFDFNNLAVAGISVSGPTSRMTEDRVSAIAASVVKAGKALTAALGGEPR